MSRKLFYIMAYPTCIRTSAPPPPPTFAGLRENFFRQKKLLQAICLTFGLTRASAKLYVALIGKVAETLPRRLLNVKLVEARQIAFPSSRHRHPSPHPPTT